MPNCGESEWTHPGEPEVILPTPEIKRRKEPQGDEGLLSPEEMWDIDSALAHDPKFMDEKDDEVSFIYAHSKFCKAQRDLTAAAKDREWEEKCESCVVEQKKSDKIVSGLLESKRELRAECQAKLEVKDEEWVIICADLSRQWYQAWKQDTDTLKTECQAKLEQVFAAIERLPLYSMGIVGGEPSFIPLADSSPWYALKQKYLGGE